MPNLFYSLMTYTEPEPDPQLEKIWNRVLRFSLLFDVGALLGQICETMGVSF